MGTNVAADALSNLASAGVIGGALIVVGEDYGAGASVIQERTHSFALKSSLCLFDPRPALGNLARMVEEGFALSEASNLPTVISLRIRAAHLRGSMVCKDNVRPRIGMLDRLARPSFDYGRISHPPSTYAQEAQKFERRLPAARRFVVEHGLNEVIPGEEQGRRHHPAGRARPRRRCGRSSCSAGPTSMAEPRAAAGAERDPPPRARAAPGVPGRQAARPRAGRGHAELHRAGAEGAGLRARIERRASTARTWWRRRASTCPRWCWARWRAFSAAMPRRGGRR